MKLLVLETQNPYYNLAVEEYFFSKTKDTVFILWQNEPTVVIGKNQNAFCEVDSDYTKKNNIHISRRITGGGAVYHDLGNVNYSFITNKDDSSIDFASYTLPIIEALRSLGVYAELGGRNDILVDGKKISGNAQYSTGGRILHHGTLLFNSDLSVLSSALHVDEEKIKSKAIKSVRSRVTNIVDELAYAITVDEFIGVLADFIKSRFSAEIIDAPKAREIEILAERNASDRWLYPERDYLASYEVRRKRRFDFGSVEICLKMTNSVIKEAKIYGDYFEISPTAELEKSLLGLEISNIINDDSFTPEKYISGMTKENLIDLLTK